MIRDNLDSIGDYPLPDGYSFRFYQDGDQHTWTHIHELADEYSNITDKLFTNEFGTDIQLITQRQVYLLDSQGNPIGTTTAWMKNNHHGRDYGLVHWVAIIPQMQGKHLAKPMLTYILNHLRNLNHDCAFLATSTARLPAIHLYLAMGFVPEIRTTKQYEIWHELKQHINVPLDLPTHATENNDDD